MFFEVFCNFVPLIYNFDMANNEPGYVYTLTNPSFREDWVKIGKINSLHLLALSCQKSIAMPLVPIKEPSISRITGILWIR